MKEETHLFIHVTVESIALCAMLFAFYKRRDFISGMMSLFLSVGVLVDFLTIELLSHENARYVVLVYCLFEAFFFLFLVGSFHRRLQKKYWYFISIIFAWWIYTAFFTGDISGIHIGYHSWFDILYEGGTAFFSAYTLIKLTEKKHEQINEFAFWILISIFFYTFSVFFIHNFVGYSIAHKIWYVSNLIDSIAMLSYSFAAIQWARKGNNWRLAS